MGRAEYLYAGVRPVKAYPNAPQRLADERAAGIDLVILRESTEGLFYSAAAHGRAEIIGDSEVRDTLRITRDVTERLHHFALLDLAGSRHEEVDLLVVILVELRLIIVGIDLTGAALHE